MRSGEARGVEVGPGRHKRSDGEALGRDFDGGLLPGLSQTERVAKEKVNITLEIVEWVAETSRVEV